MSAKKTTTAQNMTQPVEAAMAASKETVETVVKAGTEAATKGYEKAVAMSKEQVEAAVKAGNDAYKGYEEVVSYNKENVEAVLVAGTTFVSGMQEMNKAFYSLAQASMEDSVAATKKMMTCKSLNDVIAIQSDLAKANYEKALAESRKFSDMGVKLAEEAASPIAGRVSVTVEKITKPLAA